jgi:acetate kinase
MLPMNVLVLNAGSSTLKFQLIAADSGRTPEHEDERLCRGQIERIGGTAIIAVHTRRGSRKFTAALPDICASLEYLMRWIESGESKWRRSSILSLDCSVSRG